MSKMTAREGRNLVACFFNIDGYLLEHVLGDKQQEEFCRDPVRYFLRCDDERVEAIWEAVWNRHVGRAA